MSDVGGACPFILELPVYLTLLKVMISHLPSISMTRTGPTWSAGKPLVDACGEC